MNAANKKENLIQEIYTHLDQLDNNTNDGSKQWKTLEISLVDPSRELSVAPIKEKEASLTDDVLNMMEQRRKSKNKENQEYRNIKNEIRTRTRQTKQTYFEENCKEIEEPQNKYDLFNKYKEMIGMQCRNYIQYFSAKIGLQ